MALNAVKFLGWLKKFGPAQKILGPVKGQGTSLVIFFLVFVTHFLLRAQKMWEMQELKEEAPTFVF